MSRSSDPCAGPRCTDCDLKLCVECGNDAFECVRGLAIHCAECAANCPACDQLLTDGAA